MPRIICDSMHPPMHHPLEAGYYQVLQGWVFVTIVSSWVLTSIVIPNHFGIMLAFFCFRSCLCVFVCCFCFYSCTFVLSFVSSFVLVLSFHLFFFCIYLLFFAAFFSLFFWVFLCHFLIFIILILFLKFLLVLYHPLLLLLFFMFIIMVPELLQKWRWQSQSSGKDCEQMELPHHQAQVMQIPSLWQAIGRQTKGKPHPLHLVCTFFNFAHSVFVERGDVVFGVCCSTTFF